MNRSVFGSDPCRNPAEFLLQLALALRPRRHTITSIYTSSVLASKPLVTLAIAFDQAPDRFKLRALVEDWTIPVIQSRLVEVSGVVCPGEVQPVAATGGPAR